MAIAREAEPVGSLSEVKDAGLDREDLLGMYRSMLITAALEERGHTLYKQGKIPGSFYTGRGNEAAAVGVAGDGAGDVGTPLHRDMGVHIHRGRRAVADLRQLHGARRRADARPGRERPLRRRAPRQDRDGQSPPGDAAGRGRARSAFRIRDERRVAVGWFGEGASARGDATRR